MKSLSDPRVLYVKGVLMLVTGCFAAALLLWTNPAWQTLFLMAVAVWAFCRAYYFAFYVIERYIDPSFRFSGLLAFAAYVVNRRRRRG